MPNQLIAIGQEAPDFKLLKSGQNFEKTEKNQIQLSSFRDKKNIVLAFYPADWSTVCSSQIVLYNEMLPMFDQYDATIFGISVDGPFCHFAFKEKNNISIELLCDFEPKGELSKKYGAYNNQLGISERVLYVIDKKGIVQYNYLSPMAVNPGAKEIFDTLKNL